MGQYTCPVSMTVKASRLQGCLNALDLPGLVWRREVAHAPPHVVRFWIHRYHSIWQEVFTGQYVMDQNTLMFMQMMLIILELFEKADCTEIQFR